MEKGEEDLKALHAAVEHGDQSAVENLLRSSHISIDAHDGSDSYFYTPLYRAVDKGDLEMAAFLLERGANPNYYRAFSILQVAAGQNRIDLVELLLSYGAILSEEPRYDPFAFITKMNGSTVVFFLGKGITLRDRQVADVLFCPGFLPEKLDEIINEYGNQRYVDIMERGFNVQVARKSFDVADVFLKHLPTLSVEGALCDAIAAKDSKILDYLESKGVQYRPQVLLYALKSGSVEMVKFVLDKTLQLPNSEISLDLGDVRDEAILKDIHNWAPFIKREEPQGRNLIYWFNPIHVAYHCRSEELLDIFLKFGSSPLPLFSSNEIPDPWEFISKGTNGMQLKLVKSLEESLLHEHRSHLQKGTAVTLFHPDVQSYLIQRYREMSFREFAGMNRKLVDLLRFKLFYDWNGSLKKNTFSFQIGENGFEVKIDQRVSQVLFDTTSGLLERSRCAKLAQQRNFGRFPERIVQYVSIPMEISDDEEEDVDGGLGAERPSKKQKKDEDNPTGWTDLAGDSDDEDEEMTIDNEGEGDDMDEDC